MTVKRLDAETQILAAWARGVQGQADDPFQVARQLVRRLGIHLRDNKAEIGFWIPDLVKGGVADDAIYLEVLYPATSFSLCAYHQTTTFKTERIRLLREGDFCWGVVAGMKPGSRHQCGSLYWLAYQDEDGEWQHRSDPMAYSVPYGCLAPSEFYDIARLDHERADREHFQRLQTSPDPDGVMRVNAPTNILQIHIGTASEWGTLEGLQRIYEQIAHKIRHDEMLTPAEQNFIGYDAIQLMPIEPTIEYESGPLLWDIVTEDDGLVTVNLRRPDMTNWGYDVMLSASPAPNPTLLGSGRPDELVDLIATLHNFPTKPIGIIFDIVYGHGDNQSLGVMDSHFFAGPNMYGQNLDYTNPVVRAILLEMQRRKSNYGVDGIRVDGAQDFKYYVPETNSMVHDDEYLHEMNDLVQEVAGIRYRPWMIFEDGRPWPRDDWELASSYREVTKRFPNVFQWGPLTFAHNTPFKFTFWISKWWRIREMAEFGSHWITGCANHDTLHRGTQVNPQGLINTYLGESLPEIFKNAYDNAAANLLHYAFLPGVPMDFINALMRSPWSFIRNIDDRWGVKVVSEEAFLLDWLLTDEVYLVEENFRRLKDQGFADRPRLRQFVRVLDGLVKGTEYDLENIVAMLNINSSILAGRTLDVPGLKQIVRAWMDDMLDYCNISRYQGQVDPVRAQYNFDVRQFRRQRPWLMENLGEHDVFDYQHPTEASVIFYGLRHAPDNSEQVLFIANMEGMPATVVPAELPIGGLADSHWNLALATPGLEVTEITTPVTLADSQGVVFVHRMS